MSIKSTTLLLILALTASLWGCADDSDTGPIGTQQDAGPDEVGEDTPEPEPQPDVVDPEPEPEPEPQPDPEPEPEPDPQPEPEPEPQPDPEPEVDPCDSFALVQTQFSTLPLTSIEIEATGGSGDYLWTFTQNNSGGILDGQTGLYLSGEGFGVLDEVDVTDVTCQRTLKATIEVFTPIQIAPADIQVVFGTEVCFEVVGGSGNHLDPDSPFRWEIVQPGSGDQASIGQDGCYVAGLLSGQDVIRVTDTATGDNTETGVLVLEQPEALRPTAYEVMFPQGDSFPLSMTGGSGLFEVRVDAPNDPSMTVEPQPDGRTFRLLADAAGTARVRVVDVLNDGLEVEVVAISMARTEAAHEIYGSHSDDYQIVDLGDVNGDGIGDVALGVRHAGLNGLHSGAAYLYLGSRDEGLSPEPAQIIVGPHRYAFMGRSLTGGDFNGDGCGDLAIGVFNVNINGRVGGEVQIWTGCNDREAPAEREDRYGRLDDNLPATDGPSAMRLWRTLPGQSGGDRFGYATVVGDFDGDGNDDLAVSAAQDEAPTRINPSTNAPYVNLGRVYVYLHRGAQGIEDEASIIIDGMEVAEDLSLIGRVSQEFGYDMDTADINGDGCDDLLVGTARGNNFRGFTNLHVSVASGDHPSGCVLSADPALGIAESPEDAVRASRMGWQVDFGDFNGDCIPDIVTSAPTSNTPGQANSAAGSVNIFFGDSDWHPDRLQYRQRLQADIVLTADRWDQLGWGVESGDIDGDNIDDLLVGVRFAESDGTASDIGEVRVFKGTIDPSECAGPPGEVESYFEPPSVLVNSPQRRLDLFGASVAIVGDVDGDDQADLLTFAERGPAFDLADTRDHLGVLYWMPGGELEFNFDALRPLNVPAVVGDEYLGFSVAIVGDLNNDNYADAVVGAPLWDFMQASGETHITNASAGTAYIHFGGPDGLRATPDMMIAEHNHHTGGDQVGYDVVGAGDFNGDGSDDLAVSAPFEDLLGACVACRINNVNRSDSGAIYIYNGNDAFGARFDGPISETPRLSEPDAVVCGPADRNSSRIGRSMIGGFDTNGDGFDDMMVADWNWSGNRGRVWSVPAAATPQDGPLVICLNDEQHMLGEGIVSNDFLGWAMAAGDLDGDGCDDMLASAYNADPPGLGNAGIVRVWMGSGGRGCRAQPAEFTLHGSVANDNMGYGLALADTNGDGTLDLVVGSTGVGPQNSGVALVYNGALLRARLQDAQDGDLIPLAGDLLAGAFLDPTNGSNYNFGVSIESAGDLNGDGFDEVIIGSQLARFGSDLPTGAAYLYFGSDDFAQITTADVIMSGHTNTPDGRFGYVVDAGAIDLTRGGQGAPYVIVGSPFSESTEPGLGEVGSAVLAPVVLP